MNLLRVVLLGPTGAGKSQFCNFLHKDLSNSTYEVSNSLNSCTSVPQSTIVERQNIQLELIDSPGNSDSNNKDEANLKVLTQYLRKKKEIHKIFLLLSFEDRLSHDTRNYLKILSWIFTPMQFMSNLIVIFTHYPKDPDEDDIEKFHKYKFEINEILIKIFAIPNQIRQKLPQIPVYRFNTKIIKRNNNRFFDPESLKASYDLIEELKFLTTTLYYHPIKTENLECDKSKILEKVKNEQKELLETIEELKKNKEEAEKLKEQVKREQEEYEKMKRQMQTNNRTTLNDSEETGIGGFLAGLAFFGMVLLDACQIF